MPNFRCAFFNTHFCEELLHALLGHASIDNNATKMSLCHNNNTSLQIYVILNTSHINLYEYTARMQFSEHLSRENRAIIG